jgi:hypothetical protein
LIEAETGLRFCIDTICTRRTLLGLDRPRRNDWAAPLRRGRPWRAGWAAQRPFLPARPPVGPDRAAPGVEAS